MPFLAIAWKSLVEIFLVLIKPPVLYLTMIVLLFITLWVCKARWMQEAYDQGVQVTTDHYESVIAATKKQQEESVVEQRLQQKEVVDAVTARLDTWEKKEVEFKTIIKEVHHYVTPKSDAACIIPVGFLRVHDMPLPTSAGGLPLRGTEDDESPSGIALSTVAATVAANYSECEARGELILSWQEWYVSNKAIYESAILKQSQPLNLPPK